MAIKRKGINEQMESSILFHDTHRPFAPENGQALKFNVGDKVVFTNDYGKEFPLTITGLYQQGQLYCYGYRYLVNTDSPWFPAKESSLRSENEIIENDPNREFDDWGREIFRTKNGKIVVDVDGDLYATNDYGEPLSPIGKKTSEIRITKRKEAEEAQPEKQEKEEESFGCKEAYISHILKTHTNDGVLEDARIRCENTSSIGLRQIQLAWHCWQVDKIRVVLDAVLHEDEIKRIRGNSHEEKLTIAKANAIVARMANTQDTGCQVTVTAIIAESY